MQLWPTLKALAAPQMLHSLRVTCSLFHFTPSSLSAVVGGIFSHLELIGIPLQKLLRQPVSKALPMIVFAAICRRDETINLINFGEAGLDMVPMKWMPASFPPAISDKLCTAPSLSGFAVPSLD